MYQMIEVELLGMFNIGLAVETFGTMENVFTAVENHCGGNVDLKFTCNHSIIVNTKSFMNGDQVYLNIIVLFERLQCSNHLNGARELRRFQGK